MGQIDGRNAASWEQKLRTISGTWTHASFWLDIKIIILTIWKTIKREGISQPGHATMAEFTGIAEQEERVR